LTAAKNTRSTRSRAALRDRAILPRLGVDALGSPAVLDTNVFINALAGRGPPILRALLASLPRHFVAAPTCAELSWVRGRLDPEHPNTTQVLAAYGNILGRIAPEKILVPNGGDWLEAGALAGEAARATAGGGKRIDTAFDRGELISDALTAVVAEKAGLPVITEDRDFDLMAQMLPGLQVLFYDRAVD
jgi:predicted nucleic acid-binding protein